MPIVTETLTLPKLAYLKACELAGVVGEPHPVFGSNQHYVVTDEIRRRTEDRTWEMLSEQGLARRGVINPLFKSTIELLTHPDREYYGWCVNLTAGATATLVVAAREQDAVRVLLDDATMVIEPISARWLPDDFVSTLPEVDGAKVRDTSVTAVFYGDPLRRDPGRPLAEPPDDRPVRYLADLMAAPRDGIYQLYTAIRRGGERIRSTPLTAIDLTGRGRILTYTNHDGSGVRWVNLLSGTPHNLITTLERTNSGL